jgi:hypothetical protein
MHDKYYFSPGLGLGKLVDLLLEVDNDLLMLLAQKVRSFLRFEVDIFQQLAELGQFSVSFPVDLKLQARFNSL